MKLREPQDRLPVMQLEMLFLGSSSSSSLHVPGQIVFQKSHKLHALKPSTGSRSDIPMLSHKDSVFLLVTHPGGDLSPLPSSSPIPPSALC